MKRIFIALKLAIKTLHLNPGRTVLSLLGVFIGVASVILVLSFGAGLESFVLNEVQSFGTDLVQIEVKVPNTEQLSAQNATGVSQINTFKLKDAELVANLPNVSDWYAGVISQSVVKHRENNKMSMMMGVSAGFEKTDSAFEIEEGLMFNESDDDSLRQVIILGSDTKEFLFGSGNALGQDIKLGNKNFKVVGVAKKRGSGGFFNWDDLVYLPIQTLQKKLTGLDYISFAFYKIENLDQMEVTMAEMERVMREQHNIENPAEDDFAVTSIAEASELLKDVLGTVNILLVALTSISLLVGGVGIMNVMYVAVTERTFEIGLRKSLGAKNGDILKQFLFEALFLTLIGGFLGIFIGFVFSKLGELIILKFGYDISFPVSLNAVFLGISFSFVVGLIFGIYPAKKASQLSPMEALRKE